MLFQTTEGAVVVMSFQEDTVHILCFSIEIVNPQICSQKTFVRKVCSLAHCQELTQQRITKENNLYSSEISQIMVTFCAQTNCNIEVSP